MALECVCVCVHGVCVCVCVCVSAGVYMEQVCDSVTVLGCACEGVMV